MKRIALLTVLLLALGVASSFAADVIAPTIVATADLKWGITLDKNGAGDMVNGFNNSASILLYVPLISYQTLTSKGSGTLYGEFDLTNAELEVQFNPLAAAPGAAFIQKTITVDGGTGFTATAKIVAGNIQVGVYAAPSLSLDKVAQYGADAVDTPAHTAVALIDAYSNIANSFGLYGTYVSYVSDALTVTGKVVSTGDWTAATKNDYNLGAEASLVFAPVTLGFGGYYSLAAGNPAPLAYVTLAVAQPMDAMKLSVSAAADLVLATTMSYDASAGVTFYLNSHKDSAGAAAYDSYVGADLVYNNDNSVGGTKDLEAHVVLAEPGDNGFVDKLAFQVDAWLQNLMTANALNTKIVGSGSYKVMLDDTNSVTPSFGFTYGTRGLALAAHDASVTMANIAVAASIIPKTTITATWTSGNLAVANSAAGTIGNFIIDTTITF